MKGYVRLLMLGALIVGLLAACAQPTLETVEVTRVVTEQEEVEVTRQVAVEPEVIITFWSTDNEAERVTRYEEVAQRFMDENSNIEVRIVPIEEAGVSQRMATALAAQRPLDIIPMGVERIAAFAVDDILDEEVASTVIQNVGEHDFRDGPLQMVTNPETGNYAGIPSDGWIQAIWYRQDLFDQAGLPASVSWDDINQACDGLPDMEELQYTITLGTDPGQNYAHQIFEEVPISNDA